MTGNAMHKRSAYDSHHAQKTIFSVQSIVQHPAAQTNRASGTCTNLTRIAESGTGKTNGGRIGT